MSHEFGDAEMMPCDLCGEFWPGDEMVVLEDLWTCCPKCLAEVNAITEADTGFDSPDSRLEAF